MSPMTAGDRSESSEDEEECFDSLVESRPLRSEVKKAGRKEREERLKERLKRHQEDNSGAGQATTTPAATGATQRTPTAPSSGDPAPQQPAVGAGGNRPLSPNRQRVLEWYIK